MKAYSNVLGILGEVYAKYKHEPVFSDFAAVNDLGLPLAYLELGGFATPAPEGTDLVMETWHSFCTLLDLDPEKEWTSLEEMFIASPVVKMAE